MTKAEKIALRAEKARENFKSGYNCSQAVALAFCDLLPIDEETLLKLASPFGGGMARMREVCGAVSGMFLVEGFLLGYASSTDAEEKTALYAKAHSIAEKYAKENGSIVCRELLSGVKHTEGIVPEERNEDYYKKRPCAELVYHAAYILAEHLYDEGIEGA